MLIGDSIRLSYQPTVKRKLADVAEVWGTEDNCRYVKYTLWCVNDWIAQCGKPDIVHWNNGIWDAYRLNPEMGLFTPRKEYLVYLKRVLAELRKTGATILWATTTPVKPECQNCRGKDIDAYNAAAVRLMAAENIAVNDLNGLLKSDMNRFLSQDNVHLSEDGIETCGEAVARRVRERL